MNALYNLLPLDVNIFLTALAVIYGGVSSGIFARRFADRWGIRGDGRDFFTIVGAAVAGIIMYFVAHAAMDAGGVLFGIISVFASIPLVGLTWIVVVGGNKALERILGNLLKKLS